MPPMYGKCPKCDSLVTRLDASKVQVAAPNGRNYNGVTFLCPTCQVVLGAGIDPVALAEDLAQRVGR